MKLLLTLALLGLSAYLQEAIAAQTCSRSAIIERSHEYQNDHNLIEAHKRAIQEIHKAYEATPTENPFPIWGDFTTDYKLTLEILHVKEGSGKPFVVKRLTAYTEKGSVRAQTAFYSGSDGKRTKWTILKPEKFEEFMKCKFVGTLRRMTTVYGSDKPRKNTLRSQVTSGTANSSAGPNVMRKQTIQILNPQEYKRYYAPPNGSEKYMRNFNKKNGGWGQRVPINFANDRRAEQRLEYVQNPGNSVSFPSNGQQGITMGSRQGYSNQNQLSFQQYSVPVARTNSIILTDNNAYSQQSYGQPHYHNSAAVMYLTK